MLTVQLFGEFQLSHNNVVVTALHQTRLQALLAYLLLHRHAPQSRQHLAFLFWPDSSEAQARANLRQLLHYLHQALPNAQDFLLSNNKTVQWNQAAPYQLDVADFAERLTEADIAEKKGDQAGCAAALAAAVDLYCGDLLPACYDDWLLPERERWRERFTTALEKLLLFLEAQRTYDQAIHYAQRLLRHDPLHESTYRHLMRLYALNDDRASALRIYHTCATILQRELGVEPHPSTQESHAQLLNQPIATLATVPASMATNPLVGRQAEWSQLQTAWRRATVGSPHFVLVTGEAGIGKTRLIEEMLHWTEQQGIRSARTRSYAAEGALAYSPVIEWLRSEALQAALRLLEAVWLTEISRLLPELLIRYPALTRPEPLDERWQRQRLFEALARAFTIVKQPLLLAIDDLQWCDPETLAWLHYLLRFNPKSPLLVIGTVRTEEVDEAHPLTALLPILQRQEQVTELALNPLTAAEVRTLAVQTAGQDIDNPTLERLIQFSEGNPLFVVETIRVQRGAWAADLRTTGEDAANPDHHVLPPKVHAIIQHRLQQLSSTARAIANLAAVIGRSFTFAVLAHASDLGEETLARALDELWQRRMIREQGVNAYDFSHDRIREAVYALISPIRRRLLHSRIAEALKRLHQDDLDESSALLAAHYEQGGLVQQAIEWHQRAATVAERRYVYTSAINYVDAALRLLLTLPQTAERIKQRLSLLLAKASHLMPVYGLVSQERATVYEQVAALVDHVADDRLRFIARCRLRGFYGVSGSMQKAYEQAEELLVLALQLNEPLLRLEACQGYGMVNLQLGQFSVARHYWTQAEALFATQLADAEREEYGPIITTMSYLALDLWLLGYPDQARHKMAAALMQAETIAKPIESSVMLFFASLLYRHMGEEKLLSSVQEKLSTLYTQHAIWTTKLESVSIQGWLAVQQGDFAQGIEQMRMEIDAFKKTGHTMFQTHRLGLLIEAQLKAGQFMSASTTLEEAFAMSEQSGQRSFDAGLHRLRGEWLMQSAAHRLDSEITSQESAAEAAFWQAIELARSQEAKSFELRAVMSLCHLWQRQHKRVEARVLLAEIYGWFTEGFDTDDLREAAKLLNALAYM